MFVPFSVRCAAIVEDLAGRRQMLEKWKGNKLKVVIYPILCPFFKFNFISLLKAKLNCNSCKSC